MTRVVVTRPELPGTALEELTARADAEVVVRNSHEPIDVAECIALLDGAAIAVVTGMDRLPAAVFDAVPDLRHVATVSVGTDAIDLDAAAAHDVSVSNVPATMAEACADHTFGLLLAARRRLVETDRAIRAGEWRHLTMHSWLGAEVSGARLGLVGFGAIAQAVARRAVAFGIDVVHHHRRRGCADHSTGMSLDQLLEVSDIVSLHVPLTPATHHLIDAVALGRMRPNATLINTARGAVVDEAALLDALAAGRLHSVALDVFEREPLDDVDHPLLRYPNVVVSPHAASATESTRAAMVSRAVTNVVAVLDGAPPPDLVTE